MKMSSLLPELWELPRDWAKMSSKGETEDQALAELSREAMYSRGVV